MWICHTYTGLFIKNKDKVTGGKGTEEVMFMTVEEVASKMNVLLSTAYEFIIR